MTEPLESTSLALLRSGELLEDDDWLLAALERWGIPRGGPLEPADREALRELRELLRRLAESVATRGSLSPTELAELNEIIGATPVRAELVQQPDGRYYVEMTPAADVWRELAVRELAGAFASLLRESHPTRLRLCESCGAVFWDATRSRTRRWCDSRTCGNRARVRRHRERHAP